MLPQEQGTEQEGRVRVVYNPRSGQYLFQDPDRGNIFIRRDEAVGRLKYDPKSEQVVDSFGNAVGVGSMGMPAAGYQYEFKYKTAEYKPLTTPPQDFEAAPGSTLQVRVVIVDAAGNVKILYKSFGEGQKWDPETEAKMIGEAESETVPGQTTIVFRSPMLEGIEVGKSYTVQKVSSKPIGP